MNFNEYVQINWLEKKVKNCSKLVTDLRGDIGIPATFIHYLDSNNNMYNFIIMKKDLLRLKKEYRIFKINTILNSK